MKGLTKQVLETGKEVLVALGVHSVLKDQAKQAVETHFGGVGKNDERTFASTLLQIEKDAPGAKDGILHFISSLEDWQQVQFIYFVAKMQGLTSPTADQSGKVIKQGSPGERKPFLEGLAVMQDNDIRLDYLEKINFFSPISLDRFIFEVKKGGKKLIKHLQDIDWREAKTTIKKADELQKKAVSWLQKLEQKTRRR